MEDGIRAALDSGGMTGEIEKGLSSLTKTEEEDEEGRV